MKIGVATVTYNSASVLSDFMQSVIRQDYSDFCLYVIDNNSQDSTLSIVNLSPLENKVVVKNEENFGVAKANNQAIELALQDGCEFVLLINNDTLFESTLFRKLVDAHMKYQSSVVVPKIKFYNSNEIWSAGGFFEKRKAFLNCHIGHGEEDAGQFDQDDVVDYAPTCCTLMHKSVFEDVGLMDEKYFVYWDDTDFFFRIMKHSKHEVRYIFDVEFEHKVGSLTKSHEANSPEIYSSFYIEQMTKNHVYFLRKQASIFCFIQLIYLWTFFTLRFFVSKHFEKKISVFILIQMSFFKGLFIKR